MEKNLLKYMISLTMLMISFRPFNILSQHIEKMGLIQTIKLFLLQQSL